MILYAVTVVASACLLFLIQPLITRMILPWFGGTSAVWITALAFFQVCLLCGYSYAHWLSAKVAVRRQWLIHIVLLVAACALLPVIPSPAWRPEAADPPLLRILLLLGATVGLPCVVLSATSPLLQVWYMRSSGHRVPLWLFAWSNAGSLAALLGFPLLLEPVFATQTLAWAWSAAFAVFAVLCAIVAWRSRSASTPAEVSVGGPVPELAEMGLWILYPAAASALLTASTVQLTANVAPIPLLWVVPLALYLLTFILNFGSRRVYERRLWFPFVVVALGCLAWLYANSETHQDIRYVIPLYLAGLFIVCMMCHGELVMRAPAGAYLTRFYLLIALGGALGGIFAGIVAPLTFDSCLELPLLLIVLGELALLGQWHRRGAGAMLWPMRIVMLCGVLALAGFLLRAEDRNRQYNLLMTRNFYGTLAVRDHTENAQPRRSLIHGTIRHGYQFLDPARRDVPASYYGEDSGIGRVLRKRQAQGPMRVGLIGLGAGILTAYARRDDEFVIYEINQAVVDIAQREFTFLSDARRRQAKLDLVMGDARLSLERQPPQHFDVLILDAFSSDAIPMHLLTREAFVQYRRHLSANGVLAVHISNRYLDLEPVCARAAQQLDMPARLLHTAMSATTDASDWVIVGPDEEYWGDPVFANATVEPLRMPASFAGWTDQYSSLWPLLKLRAP